MMWILTLVAFLIMVSGCATTNMRLVEDELARSGTGLLKKEGQSIDGYILRDGTKVDYKGLVRLADQDTLRFWNEKMVSEVMEDRSNVEGDTQMIKVLEDGPIFVREAVKALDVREAKVGATVLLVVVSVVGFIAVMAAATFELSFDE